MSAFSKPVLAKLVALAAILAALTAAAAEAQRAPLERDGWRHGAIHNGRQNMPVILPGVAGQWSGSCAGGDAVACTRLADAFTDGHGDIRPNLSIAVGYRLAACRAGSGPSCAIAAALIRSGEAGYVDHALAAATAQTGCETRRDAESCALLGASLHAGEGIARDPARAQALWRDACTRGSSEACRLDAEARLHAGDADSAFAAFREACAAGRAWGCGRLAAAHRTGQGAAPDLAAAADYAARGCQPDRGESDPAACAHHGYFLSRSGDRDEVGRGSMLLTRSCLAGIAEACFEAGELGRRNPPGSRLAAWEVALSYRDGCDLSHGPSCHGLGRLYLQGAGDIRRDQSRAIALIDHACTLGDASACRRAEAMGAVAENARRRPLPVHPARPAAEQIAAALDLVRRGQGQAGLETVARLMEEGEAEASWVLAGWLFYGEPGVIDVPRPADGVTLAENAASQGHFAAARWVGMVHWEGDRVPADREKARRYMRIAMESGEPLDEALYRSMTGTIAREAAAAELDRQLAAAYTPQTFWSQVIAGLAAHEFSPSYASAPSTSATMARYQQQADRRDFNNFVRYLGGGTTACPSSNRYCR